MIVWERRGLRLLATSLLLAVAQHVRNAQAGQCTAFDNDGNAYIFSETLGDFDLGTELSNTSSWASIVNITGRPDFTGNATQCLTNQFTNGLYVLGATSNASDVHIFDFSARSWSRQSTSDPPATGYTAILDHDTVTMYAFANGTMYALALNQEGATATTSPITWQAGAAANAVPFTTTDYQPVLGAANNHIQFLNVPGAPAGDAYIFVIHYAYFQPEIQSFGNFSTSPGKAVTINSNSSAAPNTFAYIPDDASGTYVINARRNTTTMLPPPSIVDPLASYAASTDTLLQLTSNGTLAHINLTSPGAAWTSLILPLLPFNYTS